MTTLNEQILAAWTSRRADERHAMLATAATTPVHPEARYISEDGNCLRCISGKLELIERQPHNGRDWAICWRCETQQPCAEGVL